MNEWIVPKEPVWLLRYGSFTRATIQSLSNDVVICLLEDGNYAQAKKNQLFQRDPLHKIFSRQRLDLMDTDILNQPEILQTLKLRLQNNRIYTFVENSLISVNPYTSIPELYLDQLKDFYIKTLIEQDGNPRDFEPHLYSIAGQMIGCLRRTQLDQAVIISGQSGAGKTEANKECLRFLLRYFHSCSGSLDHQVQAVLSLSNPVLQAFGNSKTIRNNNSSRFGKYLNISLSPQLQIKDVKIFNYLLQKSRIISRADNQQNFHIFYELLQGLTLAQKKQYCLCSGQGKPYNIEDFSYLRNKDNQYQRHPEVSFEKVKSSLITLEREDSYDLACRVLAAILLLGNLVPFQSENEDCCKMANEDVLDQICRLLRVKKALLSNSLTCYPIRIGSETLTKYFNCRQVQQLINSLAKILYQRLFQWIINQINSISHYQPPQTLQLKRLGFLDIYGFQILQQNSLQQLFINYTNQRLHQIYLTKIFKQQQQLFKSQGLGSKFKGIPYEDNISVLELIDYEQLSIFNLLDQWCSVASPDDSSFITKIRHKHKKHQKFPIHNFNLPSTMFAISHSPKEIQYTVIGFRDKNRDLVREQIKNALKSSEIVSLSEMFSERHDQPDPSLRLNHKFRKFLSSKFRHEINNLVVDLIGKSNLHFIRCVKSNNLKAPLCMDDEVVYNQICYLGILDTIKLKKIGYCVKVKYSALDRRFQWLFRDNSCQPASKETIIRNLTRFLPRYNEDDIIFGDTMAFFKDYAFITLNKKYQMFMQELQEKILIVQKRIISFNFQQKVKKMKCGGTAIKNYLTAFIQHRKYQRMHRGLIEIQKNIRVKLNSLKKAKRIKNILTLQAYIKKSVCKKKKQKVFGALQKIINLIKRYQLRKNIQKYAVVNIVRNWLIDRVWKKIVLARKNVIETYLHGFLIQIGQKSQIVAANFNTHKKFQERYLGVLATYLHGFRRTASHERLMEKVRHTQRVLTTWLCRQRFLKLRKAAITIQRAYREYYFNKNTARQIFDINFGEYHSRLQSQNESIRNVLYENTLENSLKLLYHSYLGKYREKCSVFYVVIDFEAFVSLDLCYPGNSWLLNYFQVVKETLEKDNPIQSLEVGETYSVAASTNRLYLWGMNSQYNTDQNVIIVKPNLNSRLQKFSITKNSLQISYQNSTKGPLPTKESKQTPKGSSTINRQYIIQNGKIFESRNGSLKLIKLPQSGQRVAEVACGSNHVILRTSARKVYTFGNGKHGQLGHNVYHSCDGPKVVQFTEIKNYVPVQVSASFNCSLVLLSNRKIYWWGTNGTLDKVKVPLLLDLTPRFEQLGSGNFLPLRIKSSWTRTMSVIGLTLLHCQGKLSSSIPLRNKVTDLIISKWHQHGIESLNPPYYPAYSDYLQECHVKMPKPAVVIEPQSKRTLKRLQQKVNSIQTEKMDFSFSQNPK